jgi:hypothetical protein
MFRRDRTSSPIEAQMRGFTTEMRHRVSTKSHGSYHQHGKDRPTRRESLRHHNTSVSACKSCSTVIEKFDRSSAEVHPTSSAPPSVGDLTGQQPVCETNLSNTNVPRDVFGYGKLNSNSVIFLHDSEHLNYLPQHAVYLPNVPRNCIRLDY